MSFRRRPSQRSQRSTRGVTSYDAEGEVIENPNAVGLFGRYRDAPEAVQVQEHEHDDAGIHGHTHEHRMNGVHDFHPGWQTVGGFHRGHDVNATLSSHDHNRQSFGTDDGRHIPQYYFNNAETSEEPHEIISPDRRPAAQRPTYVHGTPLGPISSNDPQLVASPATDDAAHTPLVWHAAKSSTVTPHHSRRGTQGSIEENAFNAVHGSSGSHLEKYSEQLPIRFGHLFKRPLIRQWVLQDKVYRELDDREPSQFELFFDLVMVGVIHLLAEAAAEEATGLNVAKFVLCFYPAWSVWTDVRAYINVSGTDDVWQRIYILLNMILLVGYTANACGIVIEKAEGETEHLLEASGGGEASGLNAHRRALDAIAGEVAMMVVKRSGGGGEPDSSEAVFVREIGHTGYWFANGWRGAIASAIGFYLVAKTLRLALFFIYGVLLPKFRKALFLHGTAFLVITCIYLPIMFLNRPGLIVILLVVGVIVEITSRYLIAAALQIAHGRAKRKGHKTYMPAYSLPHMMERTTLFTILVIGEVIMNATYTAYSGELGPQAMFWRASLAVVIAFMLMWLYFDADSSRTFVHGLKRHWFTSIAFSNIHFPLCAALVLMGASMAKMIKQEAVEQPYLWFFSGCIAVSMFCIGMIGVLHKSLDRWGSSIFPRESRIALRFVLAAVFSVMPLLHHWKSVEFLGAFAAMLALAVAFETFGKIGSVGREYDPTRAQQLRAMRLGRDDEHDHESPGDIALGEMPSDPNVTEKGSQSKRKTIVGGVRDALEASHRKINKDGIIKSPGRHDSWHEYDDLTGAERGEDDVGIESELGRLEAKQLSSGERWAYVAT